MTPSETVMLTRYVKACCPQQAMDEFTADAWHDLLGDMSFDDCRAAVTEVAKRQPFVAPSEIRQHVREIRELRLKRTEIPPPPPELFNDPDGYQAALRAAAVAIADGRDPEAAMRTVAGQRRRELEAQ